MSKDLSRAVAATPFALVGGLASQASAAPIGCAAPIDGYYENTGVERFEASGDIFAIELMDSPGGEFGEFGIYYDKNDRITLFGADDMGSGQSVLVDLVGGSVTDVDAETVDHFIARGGDFGFYFSKHDEYVYTETNLNSGLEIPVSVGTYESTESPDTYLITLDWFDEKRQSTYGMELVGGVTPSEQGPSNAVPEPNAAMLFGLGALVLQGAIRRKR